ncbi:ABC transporter permease [Neobacillus bataviensis LMG 21833]|uniref:ABC transporter permease n=1 Tax=Neobacillus bataviensis LMG 21833 TaxID=1117379 RepID=K6E674_9BACI|nr:ABC transporter permease subunit [Neobacillus bataviensis]EKN68781.1 ABC transporter permease [Neobacillus bataviensis LMG 21833]
MNKQIISAIARKDLKATFSSKKIWVPMIILPLLLCIIFPTIFAYIGIHTGLIGDSSKDLEKPINDLIRSFPNEHIRNTLAALPNLGYQSVYFFLNFMMIPFFLLVAIINSMVTASNSFAGEKERNTLETLLFAPISVSELFLGKVIASLIPSLLISFAAFIVSAIIVNFITYPYFKEILFLNSTWLILMLWVIPALVIFNIILNVLVSARVKSFQEAQQFGGLLVLPVVGLLISQVSGLFFLSPFILLIIGAALLIANGLLLNVITKFNQRNTLFESQIH